MEFFATKVVPLCSNDNNILSEAENSFIESAILLI